MIVFVHKFHFADLKSSYRDNIALSVLHFNLSGHTLAFDFLSSLVVQELNYEDDEIR